MYVAADLCKHIQSGAQKTVMTLGAGQGKTLVYLLVALMLVLTVVVSVALALVAEPKSFRITTR